MTDKGTTRADPAVRARAPGSACCRAAGSTCSIPRRRISRSRTSPTGSPASRAGTGRRSASTPSRSPSTRCWWRRSPPRCSPDLTRRWRLAALLHDAPEYVIGDLISPFKAAIGLDYKAFENKLLEAIYRRFGLPPSLPDRITMAIKAADRIAAFYEATQLAGFTETEANRYFGVPRGVPAPLRQRLGALDPDTDRGRRRPSFWRASRSCRRSSASALISAHEGCNWGLDRRT